MPDTGGVNPSRLDRPVLVGNLVAGAFWLVVTAFVATPGLALIGAAYVVPASLYLAAFYARDSFTRGQEGRAWAFSWLGAVALWAGLLTLIGGGIFGSGHLFFVLVAAIVIATPCYLAWQLLALAVRQFLAARARDAVRG